MAKAAEKRIDEISVGGTEVAQSLLGGGVEDGGG
jgi:hypothetical protein